MISLTLLAIVLLLFLSAIFSGSETGLYSLNRVKLRYRLKRGERRARMMAALLQNSAPCIITILIGNNLAAQALATLSERSLQEQAGLGPTAAVLVTVLLLTPVVLVTGEFIPKYLFKRHADLWMYKLVGFLTALRWILVIPVAIIEAAARVFTWIIPGVKPSTIWEPHTSRPNLRSYFRAETSGHNLSDMQKELLDRVLSMERLTLSFDAVSKPLADLHSLDGGATVAAASASLGPKFFQRYIVTDHRDGTPIGYVTAVDLVTAEAAAPLHQLARELPHLPVDTPLHIALQRMHDSGSDLALVTGREAPFIAFRGDCLRVLANLI